MFSAFKVLKSLLIRQENTLTPAEVEIVPAGTASTKTTITSSQTGAVTITLPNATDTLVGKATTDTLTNKTISGASNTLSNIPTSALSGTIAIANGGTGQATQQLALNALAGAVTTAQFLRGNGTNVTMSAIQASDVPTLNQNTTGTAANITATTNATLTTLSSLSLPGSQVSGNITGNAANVTGTVAIGNGGTGQTTKTPAFDALSPLSTKGDLHVHNGTNNVRQAIGTDGQVLVADSLQTNGLKWAAITGVKNYILNPDFESSTTGWAAYANTAQSRPITGTGGSPTVTITRTTSSPLRGVGSGLLTKDAANRQGQGVSYDFTIDAADKAKVLQISFDYAIASGTYSGGSSGVDSDVIVDIYDVTNGVLVEPAPIKLDGAVSGVNYKYVGTFQSNSNSTSYRLIMHCATTSASAYTLEFDNVVVGPSVASIGSYVSDWVSYTPTGSWSTNTSYSGKWRRVGDSMEVYAYISLSGAPTATTLTVNLPTGYSIDTTKIDTTASAREPFGLVSWYDNANTAAQTGMATYSSTSSIALFGQRLAAASNNDLAPITNTTPKTFASGDSIVANYKVPIVGWGTSQALSSELDNRVVAAMLDTPTSSQAVNTTDTKVTFGTSVYDTHGGFSSSTYTVPFSGYYKVYATLQISSSSAGANSGVALYLYRNGSSNRRLALFNFPVASVTLAESISGSATVFFNAGDTVDIRVSRDAGITAFNLDTVGSRNYFSIERIAGNSQVVATETVSATYIVDGAGQVVTSAVGTPIQFNTKITDSHSAVTTGSAWKFTAPTSGRYRIYTNIFCNSVSGTSQQFSIRKNAATVVRIETLAINSGGVTIQSGTNNSSGMIVLPMNAGDYLDVAIVSAASAGSVYTGSTDSWISIERIGN